MKRLPAVLALALLLSLALGASVASATHSNGNGPQQDLVSGTGQFIVPELIDSKVHVNAKSGPSGEDPQGHFYFKREGNPAFDFRGRVTCLTVGGNRAAVGGVIEESKLPSPGLGFPNPLEGSGVLINIEDNGDADAPDEFLVTFSPNAPVRCPLLVTFAPTGQGNFIVHSATP